MKYRATYKCLMCGRMLTVGTPTEVPESRLLEVLIAVVERQKFASNPYLKVPPMQIQHNCQDGSVGLAQFAGFQRM